MKSKDQKREEATERQAVYEGLESWARELLVIGRPGNSARELARLRTI